MVLKIKVSGHTYNNDSYESDTESEYDYPDSDDVTWSDSDDDSPHISEYTHLEHISSNITYNNICRLIHTYTDIESNIRKVENPKIVEECPICLEYFRPYDQIMYCSTKCGNIFHSVCIHKIKECLKSECTIKCPLCRTYSHFLQLNSDN